MAKHYFKIDLCGYGAEFVMGTSTHEFVDQWIGAEDYELSEHIEELEMDDESDFFIWENDDIEHINAVYADGQYRVTEFALKEEVPEGVLLEDFVASNHARVYEELVEHEQGYFFQHAVYAREGGYTLNESLVDKDNTDIVPVLLYASIEKGYFGQVFIESDEPFDSDKIAFGIVETDLGDFIERVWYDKKECEITHEFSSTNGKGSEARVGYINKKWHDSYESVTEENIEDGFDCIDTELAE